MQKVIGKNVIGFVGLSHLGLNYLAASVEKKFNVIGVDLNQKLILKINKFKLPFSEPQLENVLKKNRKKINFTSNFKKLKCCNIVFISKDVETDSKGKPNLKEINKLINLTKKNLNKKCILVILSQLRPGFMKKINYDNSKLYYQIETLIFGKGLERALKPERIIVGSSNKSYKINRIYFNYLKKFNCPIINMSYESAELTKIAINIYLASSITTTNVLAEVCNSIGANWNEIKPALQLDARIGPKAYLKPGLGISGGNIERDINSLSNLISKNSSLKRFTTTLNQNSKYMKEWVMRKLLKEKIFKSKNTTISILGLSYKENTSSTKNSSSLKLIDALKYKKLIKVYDPKVKFNKQTNNCRQMSSINETLKGTKILVLMTPWKNFMKIKIPKTIKIVLDPFKILEINSIKNLKIKYYSIGN